MAQQFLDCAVTVCVDDLACSLNTRQDQCPATGIAELFQFSLLGNANDYIHPELQVRSEEGSGEGSGESNSVSF